MINQEHKALRKICTSAIGKIVDKLDEKTKREENWLLFALVRDWVDPHNPKVGKIPWNPDSNRPKAIHYCNMTFAQAAKYVELRNNAKSVDLANKSRDAYIAAQKKKGRSASKYDSYEIVGFALGYQCRDLGGLIMIDLDNGVGDELMQGSKAYVETSIGGAGGLVHADVVAFAGGLPVINAAGAIVGGIGISGVSADQDEDCARAAAEAIAAAVE